MSSNVGGKQAPAAEEIIESDRLLNVIDQPSRETVTTACQQCRKSKARCGGSRPCENCKRRGIPCVFLANEKETHTQAVKRKYDEIVRSNDELTELVDLIGKRSENEAFEIVRRIRNGEAPSAILQFFRYGNVDDPVSFSAEYKEKQRLLLYLAQSTASLQELVAWAGPIISSRQKLSIPAGETYRPLRHRIIKLDYLRHVIQQHSTDSHSRTSSSSVVTEKTATALYIGESDTASSYAPPFRVPASPWTVLTADDKAVSHLVSLFIVFLNDHWRHVEVDLFIEAMQSGQLESLYCSPLLVNSICAWASQHSELDISFTREDDFLTRGENFFHEAQRLWDLEEGNPSITNTQALMILGSDAAIRGQDKLGIQYTSKAVQLLRRLNMSESRYSGGNVSEEAHKRAKACLQWGVNYLDMTFALSLLQPRTNPDWNLDLLPPLDEILPDTSSHWTAFPLARSTFPYRKNRLFVEVSRISKILRKAVQLLLYDAEKMDAHDLYNAVQQLGAEFVKWCTNLPFELKDVKNAPAPVYDMIAHYHCTVTMLYTKAKSLLDAMPTPDVAPSDQEEDKLDHAAYSTKLLAQGTYHACEGANIIKHHRETYGVKIISPALWQISIVSAFTLLQVMGAGIVRSDIIYEELRRTGGEYSTDVIDSAFVECFRFLLGSGLQHMLARGIVRMLYLTSRQLRIELPGPAIQLLTMAAESAWTPTNINQISSVYPNLAIANSRETDDATMETLLRKWEALEIERTEPPIN